MIKICETIVLRNGQDEEDPEASGLDSFSLEMFEDIAYVMAKHADPKEEYRICRMNGWKRSIPSASTRCCRRSLICGD